MSLNWLFNEFSDVKWACTIHVAYGFIRISVSFSAYVNIYVSKVSIDILSIDLPFVSSKPCIL